MFSSLLGRMGWPAVPCALAGAAFGALAGHVDTLVTTSLLVLLFASLCFTCFGSGLGRAGGSPKTWPGSAGCLLALGTGAAFFVLFGYDGCPSCTIASPLTFAGEDASKSWMIVLSPAAAGLFTYYFIELCVRIRHPRTYLNLYACGFAALLIAATAAAAMDWTNGLAAMRLSGIVCFATGALATAGLLARVGSQMVFRRLVFDVTLMVTAVLAYYVVSAPLIGAGLPDESRSIVFVAVLQTAYLMGGLIALTGLLALAGLAGNLLRRRSTPSARRANDPNPSLVLTSIRSVAGLLSNYSICLLPVAWLAYRRNIALLQNELAGRSMISPEAERRCRRIGWYAGCAHLLAVALPVLLSTGGAAFASPVALAARIGGCAAAGALCWLLLADIDRVLGAPA